MGQGHRATSAPLGRQSHRWSWDRQEEAPTRRPSHQGGVLGAALGVPRLSLPPPPQPGRLAFHIRLLPLRSPSMQKSRVMKEMATRRRRKKEEEPRVQSSQLLSPTHAHTLGCTALLHLNPLALPRAQRPTMPHHACPGPYSRARGHLGPIWLKLRLKTALSSCLLQGAHGPERGGPRFCCPAEVGPGPMKLPLLGRQNCQG